MADSKREANFQDEVLTSKKSKVTDLDAESKESERKCLDTNDLEAKEAVFTNSDIQNGSNSQQGNSSKGMKNSPLEVSSSEVTNSIKSEVLCQQVGKLSSIEADAAEDKGSRRTMEDAWVVLPDASLEYPGKLRYLKMEGSSSYSQQRSKSKKKNRPVGPIQIHTDGKPFGPYYDALADHIARHVSHCDEFSPILNWPEHKNAGRVESLYKELTPIFSLPDWNDQRKVTVDFRKWFNDNARHRFTDNKWRSLYRTFERCKGNVDEAIQHVPERINSDTWATLCATYAKNMQADESGMSKKEKCKMSREANEYDHRMGRDALSVWCGKFRETRNRSPTAVEIYNKEFRKRDALKAADGELPDPDPRGEPVKDIAEQAGVRLQQCYDAAIAGGSDESTASTRACLETFGRVTRLGLQAPRSTRPSRRDAYTSQLEQQIQTLTQQSQTLQEQSQTLTQQSQTLRQQSQAMKEQWDADRQRIAQLEQSQREMQQFMAQFMASQQSGGRSSMGGDGASGDDDDT